MTGTMPTRGRRERHGACRHGAPTHPPKRFRGRGRPGAVPKCRSRDRVPARGSAPTQGHRAGPAGPRRASAHGPRRGQQGPMQAPRQAEQGSGGEPPPPGGPGACSGRPNPGRCLGGPHGAGARRPLRAGRGVQRGHRRLRGHAGRSCRPPADGRVDPQSGQVRAWPKASSPPRTPGVGGGVSRVRAGLPLEPICS